MMIPNPLLELRKKSLRRIERSLDIRAQIIVKIKTEIWIQHGNMINLIVAPIRLYNLLVHKILEIIQFLLEIYLINVIHLMLGHGLEMILILLELE